ncbi:hypothetical protein ACIBCM_00850 [Streptomyces sp. NPDC051018]|uniref:hypothetical protein n=1 Tax=Streptomyces sp. NPDC051018 TaxID=3365639 RepID=UPI0037B300B5
MAERVRCDRCHNVTGLSGPEGGYVCGLCAHVVEPSGYAQVRADGLKAVAKARRAKARARKAAQQSAGVRRRRRT